MSKALIFGLCATALSAGTASAQEPGYDGNGATAPLYGYAAPPAYGYAATAPLYNYAAPAYAAPAQAGTTIVIVTPAPGPAYTAPPVGSGYYAAGVVSRPIYNYAPGYWGGRGYWRQW